MGGCCPDKEDPESIKRRVGWFFLYVFVAISVYLLTSWLLPKLEEARRLPTPRIRVSPPQDHEFHPSPSAYLDRG